jgi:hypothetical protein
MACGGVLAAICFATIGPLSRKFDERLLFILVSILINYFLHPPDTGGIRSHIRYNVGMSNFELPN